MTKLVILLRRCALALLLAALLAPMPTRAPADDARAFAIALGVICVADGSESGFAHADGHCALCLAPATGAAPEAAQIARIARLVAPVSCAALPLQIAEPRTTVHNARAPPSLPV